MIDNLKRINLILTLRKLGVTNHNVLSILEKIPREEFIDKDLNYKAYQNKALPIDCNQTISQPAVVAKMTELLEPKQNSNVLEIGTGSGYQTAILSKLFKRIYTIERHNLLLEKAKKVLNKLKITNIVFYHGDGLEGWPAKFAFDRIIITAVSNSLPKKIIEQLSDNGILVLPLIRGGEQYISKVVKKNKKLIIEKSWRVRFVPLVSGIN
ncbi:MAG: protein-L-isoaspartate O-methyltransferase [Pelagibacteraceae bacterium]|nr:protein-L-isoaspartate O-methyltransferase [Pelagibacteraceae bacterium]